LLSRIYFAKLSLGIQSLRVKRKQQQSCRYFTLEMNTLATAQIHF